MKNKLKNKCMKRLMPILVVWLSCHAAFSTDVQINLADSQFGITRTTNRLVIVQPWGVSQSGSWTLLQTPIAQYTDTNGATTFSNLYGSDIQGVYHVTVPAPPSRSDFDIWVQSTNLGTVQASAIIISPGSSTYPPGAWAWSATASDARYAAIGSASGGTTNVDGFVTGLATNNTLSASGTNTVNALAAAQAQAATQGMVTNGSDANFNTIKSNTGLKDSTGASILDQYGNLYDASTGNKTLSGGNGFRVLHDANQNPVLEFSDSGDVSAYGSWTFDNIIGNGGALTNLSAANLNGTVADARLSGNVSTNKYLTDVITPEQYGAKGDMVALTDVACTNGSTTIYSPSANFTAADVGKTAVLYLDDTNWSYIVTTIASYVSPNRVQLATPSTISWTSPHAFRWPFVGNQAEGGSITNLVFTNWAEFHYFTDDTAAFQTMLNSNPYGATIELRPVCYGFSSPLIDRGITGFNENSVLHIPNQPQRPGVGNDWGTTHTFSNAAQAGFKYTYEFVGARLPSNHGESGSISGQFWKDSIFYCVSSPTTWTNFNSFIGSSTPASLGDSGNNNIVFKNISFRQPKKWPLWDLYLYAAGGFKIEDCVFDYAWRPGQGLNQFSYGIVSNPDTNLVQSGGIFMPGVNNNSDFYLSHNAFYGAPLGIIYGELSHDVYSRFWGCGQVWMVTAQAAIIIDDPHISAAKNLIRPYGSGHPIIDIRNLQFEDSESVNQTTIYDPSNQLVGSISFASGSVFTNNSPSQKLNLFDLEGARFPSIIHTTSELFRDGIFSRLGFDSHKGDIALDMPFIPTSLFTNQFYDWSVNGGLCNLAGSGNFNRVQSPAGNGLQFLGSSMNCPLVCDSTNFTFSVLAKMTNNILTYLIKNNSILGTGSGANIYASPSGGGSQVGFSAWKSDTNLLSCVATTGSSVADGLWHLYAGTCSNLNLYLYMDGALLATTANTTNLAAFVSGGQIGMGNGESVASAQVWDRTLSSEEIAAMAANYNIGQKYSFTLPSDMLDSTNFYTGGTLTNFGSVLVMPGTYNFYSHAIVIPSSGGSSTTKACRIAATANITANVRMLRVVTGAAPYYNPAFGSITSIDRNDNNYTANTEFEYQGTVIVPSAISFSFMGGHYNSGEATNNIYRAGSGFNLIRQ